MRAKLKRAIQKWRGVSTVIFGATGAIAILRLAGFLQPLELSVFDQLLRLQPQEQPDSRVVIVGIDESDIKEAGQWPIPDRALAQLLGKIQQQQPRAIGLDIYRDLPVEPGHQELVAMMKSIPNLVGIQKVVGGKTGNAIAPPPELDELNQVSADFPLDVDGKVRRAFLYLNTHNGDIRYSLGFRLAWLYLAGQDINPESLEGDRIQLGRAIFTPLGRNDGGYAWMDDRGYQMLIHYRGGVGHFAKISLTDVLEDRIESDVFRDRIVLIGAATESLEDFALTPYSSSLIGSPELMTGVEIHANVTSSLLSAALDGRSLLKTWPELLEWLWIFGGAALGATWACCWRDEQGLSKLLLGKTSIRLILSSAALVGIAGGAFRAGWWLPVAPTFLSLVGAAIAQIGWTLIANLKRSYQQIEDYASTLEIKVEQRTEQLKHKNERLEQALQQLRAAQKQMIAQEKLASLGALTAGIAHEIRNPLNFVNNFASLSVELAEELEAELEESTEPISTETVEEIQITCTDLKECANNIHKHGQRIDNIVKSMLMHAREERGQIERTNINTLLADALQLVYHNLHQKNPDFNPSIETDYDESLENIEVIPQDISRAFINIIDNAFDAINRKRQQNGEVFDPMLAVQTRNGGDRIEIAIRDNGLGIAPENRDRIFNPFFTTKPPGEGTGLGLSLTHDTIVSVHRGEIEVDTSLGNYTEFLIVLPKHNAPPIQGE